MTDCVSKSREGTSAILISTDGRFLDCIVREVHEEIGFYLPPERFELIASYFGPDYFEPENVLHGEIFLARHVPIERLAISEGTLKIVALDELEQMRDCLAPPAQYAFEMFLKPDRTA